jgi:protein-disulfide isomerase
MVTTRKKPSRSQRSGHRTRSVIARQEASEPARRRAPIVGGICVALLVLAGFAGWYAYQSQPPDRSPAATAPPAGADASGVRVGTGPVVVDVYLDFMCPRCREFEDKAADTLARLVTEGRATVVYHPLAFLDSASSTDYSTRSAAASACAADAGRFVDYAAALYAQQPAEGSAGLSPAQLINLGAVAGVDGAAFAQCVRDDRHAAWVDAVTERAVRRGITGTPTVLVDGKLVNADPTAITEAVARSTP